MSQKQTKRQTDGSRKETDRNVDVDVIEVACWVDHLLGIPVEQTAERLGVDRVTVWRRRKKVEDRTKVKITPEMLRDAVLGLNSLAIEALTHNLSAHDVPTTIAYMKGMGAYTDRTEITGSLKVEEVDSIRQASIEKAAKKARGEA